MSRGTDDAIAGVILAGGRARRMGGADKPLAGLAGKPMVAHVIARLRPQVAALAINANGDPSRFAVFDLPVVPDSLGGFVGPLAGILAGLQWARQSGCRLLVTAPADTPFLPPDLVTGLRAGFGTADVAVARAAGVDHPTIALWRVSLMDDLAGWLLDDNHRAVHEWIETRLAATVDFATGDGGDPFFNVNTPADLDAARDRLRKAGVVSVSAAAASSKS